MRRTLVVVVGIVMVLAPGRAPAIVNGTPAAAGEYPWQVAIYTGTTPERFHCGGSLVAPTIVVSAAHCVLELLDNAIATLPVDALSQKLKAFIGETDLRSDQGERIPVRWVTSFPDANLDLAPDVDLAVLELARPSAAIPIRYATPSDVGLYPDGTTSIITGWGATSEGGPLSAILLEATVPVVADPECGSAYPGQVDGETMVCAGFEQGGTDTCQGDSGGPMMVQDGGELVLVGVTSWGEGCARAGKPGVYSEVAAASDFIDSFIA
jgi:secreted trypsin-like serine protease